VRTVKNGYERWCFYLEQFEKAYWTNEAAKSLEIGESTLRKWCLELEKNGYLFVKGAMDSRAFTEHDMAALNYFKQLTKSKKNTKEQAAKLVVEQFSRIQGNEGTTPVPLEKKEPSVEDLLKQLLEQNKKQEEFNKALLQKLEQQERFIKESIEKRDQLLLESIRAKQEVAAAVESKKMKNRIKRFFGSK
jgi:hypothetical protein